jgi:hypothetical protein
MPAKPVKVSSPHPLHITCNLSFLTRPPLLRSESEREFNQLFNALKAEIQPHGVIEEMYVSEIAIIIWEPTSSPRRRHQKVGRVSDGERTTNRR